MSGWDLPNISASDQKLREIDQDELGAGANGDSEFDNVSVTQVQSKFRQFLRTFRVEEQFIYREQLVANYEQEQYFLVVDAADLGKFDPDLLQLISRRPAEFLPVFETAAKEVVSMTILPRPRLEDMQSIQVQLSNYQRFSDIRHLEAKDVSTLVCIRGIIVTAARVRVKATVLSLMCRNCRNPRTVHCSPGFGGARIPRKCEHNNGGQAPPCPIDPFIVLPDSTQYVDQQRLKLQENPEMVPTGEMPRHISLSLDRYLINNPATKPGTRISVVGIYSIFEARTSAADRRSAVAIRHPYLRVLGIHPESEATEVMAGKFRREEQEELEEMSRTEHLYGKLSQSIAPAIYGCEDIKKAVACMLFGGARKHLPDGMRLRGDINVLLLGDPSTAKSQFLKFAVQVAPIGVYTSGKGSSAAGLTASVIRDPSTGEFQLEGGALVLADGGLVCIDEFDKMKAQDRVAIHEAMEQQTISIAKAGITTILNSRASVLAAANPVFGRYDDMKSPTDNIDFQSTILSRFDLIFIVRDIRNEKRDKALAQYIIEVHRKHDTTAPDDAAAGEFDMGKLKRYIAYARWKVSPRLNEQAAEALKSYYVTVRSKLRKRENEYGGSAIPITVRQLEAIIRLSESLARMELKNEATADHVQEAIRLFQVSTYQAATSSFGGEGIGAEFMDKVKKAEAFIKRRVAIGARMAERTLLDEMTRDGGARFNESAVLKALDILNQRQEIRYLNQRKMVARLK